MNARDDTPVIPEFMDDGKCWSCGGFQEHTAGCPHARDWERFGGGL